MNDELRFHLEREVNKYEGSGLPHEEALRRARLTFGGMDQTKEECREARGVSFIETMIQDLRYAMRLIRARPSFSAPALLSLWHWASAAISRSSVWSMRYSFDPCLMNTRRS